MHPRPILLEKQVIYFYFVPKKALNNGLLYDIIFLIYFLYINMSNIINLYYLKFDEEVLNNKYFYDNTNKNLYKLFNGVFNK